MKVCHMTSVHRNNDMRIFHKECVSLANAGYDVYLVAQGQSCERNGVHIVGVDEVADSRVSRMFKTAKNVYKRALDIDADVYHIHDPELLLYAKKLAQMGKRVIFDSHEDYGAQIRHKQYIPKLLRNVISRTYKSFEASVLGHIDAVVVPCSFNGRNIFEGITKKTVYISNAPLLSQFYDRYQENKGPKEPSVCYVGVLSHSRGITHLIQAAYKADTKLILAGNFTPQGYYNYLQDMPEFKCVDYRGYLNPNEVTNVYRQSSIGACTILNIGQYNRGDNFATKVYEYMSMGLPVILSDSPYAKKILPKYNFGLGVQPDNIEEIASAIRYVRNNPDAARLMGYNGREAVLEIFNWNIEERKLIALYEELSERKGFE